MCTDRRGRVSPKGLWKRDRRAWENGALAQLSAAALHGKIGGPERLCGFRLTANGEPRGWQVVARRIAACPCSLFVTNGETGVWSCLRQLLNRTLAATFALHTTVSLIVTPTGAGFRTSRWKHRRLLSVAATVTTFTSSAISATAGQPVSLAVTVATNPPGANAPTGGTVAFLDGSTTLGTAPLVNGPPP